MAILTLLPREIGFIPFPFCRGSGSFSLEHRAEAEKFKKETGHNADCPQSLVALVVDSTTRLLHVHKARFFKQGNGQLTTALADAGISDYGSHVNVDESGIERWRTKTERGKIKVGQDCLNGTIWQAFRRSERVLL